MTNRNTNAHFELAPQVEIERSTFDRSCNIKTSFNVGLLIPFYVDEVLPGDTFQIETSKVARLQTLITPVMDNLFLDTYYFFVPNRLVWDHWKEFCGENDVGHWYYDQPTYSIPQVEMPDDGWNNHTIADYMGIPTKLAKVGDNDCITVNALPFRAYCQIYNDWFRDENLQDPVYFPHDEETVKGHSGLWQYEDIYAHKGGLPLLANKTHDYFTSCLKSPQKAPEISLFASMDMAPVKVSSDQQIYSLGLNPMRWMSPSNASMITGKRNLQTSTSGNTSVGAIDSELVDNSGAIPANLFADLSDLRHMVGGDAMPTDFTINNLRQAFQIQRLFEKDARGGTRYIEILKAHFGVTSPDARLQRAEYLGGNRVPLNIEQVVNTTGNEALSLLPGDTSGWSQTNDVSFDVNKSFVEHGYIIGIMCVRYDHSYQQGLERFWLRKDRFDFYWPALAHLGEQAVHYDEIYCSNKNIDQSRSVFGYQEAWAEYRYKPNYVTGSMRSNENNSLDIWHFADYYDSQHTPTLGKYWVMEDKNNVDRTLAVKSDVENQVFVDILVKNKCTRPMPLYSIPGLIDHF